MKKKVVKSFLECPSAPADKFFLRWSLKKKKKKTASAGGEGDSKIQTTAQQETRDLFKER